MAWGSRAPVRRYAGYHRSHEVAVRVEQRAALPRRDVLYDDRLKERRLAGASLPDDRDVTPTVDLANAEDPLIASGVRAGQERDWIEVREVVHPQIVSQPSSRRQRERSAFGTLGRRSSDEKDQRWCRWSW